MLSLSTAIWSRCQVPGRGTVADSPRGRSSGHANQEAAPLPETRARLLVGTWPDGLAWMAARWGGWDWPWGTDWNWEANLVRYWVGHVTLHARLCAGARTMVWIVWTADEAFFPFRPGVSHSSFSFFLAASSSAR